jgi:cytochrome c peroxidase
VLYPALNPPSDEKALLGKVLFWEEQMGELNTMACGTCHRSYAGGSDPRTKDFDSTANRVLAHLAGPDGVVDANPSLTSDDIRGAAGVPVCAAATDNVTGKVRQVTIRKPPSYFDAMFAQRLFWDGRAGQCNAGDGSGGCFYDPDAIVKNGGTMAGLKPLLTSVTNPVTMRAVGGALEAQSVGPPVNSTEMACTDQSWAKIEAKLKTASPLFYAKQGTIPPDVKDFQAKYGTYPKMFAAAFVDAAKNTTDNNDVINSQRIAFAIATHERRLTSNQTPWDKWRAGDDTALTPGQLRGYVAFMGPGKCGQCHPPPLFTDGGFHFIGFHKPASDEGLKVRTGDDKDLGKLKTATLRNVKLREPYGLLHNGAGPGESLETIMTLYKQGGLRDDPDIAAVPIDEFLKPLQLSQQEIDDIIDFMRNGLTDPRVEGEKPPFDRPHLSTESQ